MDNEPQAGMVYQLRDEQPIEEKRNEIGKRILNVIRNTVLLFVAIPLVSLIVIFIYLDWLLGGNSHNKIKNYIDDFVDEKIFDVVEGVQQNEQFIVLQAEENEDDEY